MGIVVLTNQHNSLLPYIVSDLVTNRMLGLTGTEWNKYPMQVMPQTMNPEFYLNFTMDDDGNVSGVKVNFQREPVEFAKQTDK